MVSWSTSKPVPLSPVTSEKKKTSTGQPGARVCSFPLLAHRLMRWRNACH